MTIGEFLFFLIILIFSVGHLDRDIENITEQEQTKEEGFLGTSLLQSIQPKILDWTPVGRQHLNVCYMNHA